jgi:competence protein ComEC
MRRWLIAAVVAFALRTPAAQSRSAKTLDIYIVDVEGGNATLFVAPSGASVLIDSGNGGAAAARDADRIVAAAKHAGINRIDHLITSHYHTDHVGGLAELAARIPILHFIDHGANVQPNEAVDAFLKQPYPMLYGKATHTVAKPGQMIDVAGIAWRIVASGSRTLETPLPGGGGPNTYCANFKPQIVNPVSGQPSGNTEDEQSVGSHITFGKFTALHLADLTWNKEFDLMCPNNPLGIVDLFVVSRHGQPSSNSAVLVDAIQPRVAVMNNGPRKGGQPETMRVLRSSSRLQDLWQLHFSLLSGQEYAAPGMFIANEFDEPPAALPAQPLVIPPGATGVPPPPSHDGRAYWIEVSAQADGTFTVTNSRNGFRKTYR